MSNTSDVEGSAVAVKGRHNGIWAPARVEVSANVSCKRAETLARVDDCLAAGSGDGAKVAKVKEFELCNTT